MSDQKRMPLDAVRASVSEAARAWRIVDDVLAGAGTEYKGAAEVWTCGTLTSIVLSSACDEMEAAIDRGDASGVRAWMACVDDVRKVRDTTRLAHEILVVYERQVVFAEVSHE